MGRPTPQQRRQMLDNWRELCAWLEDCPYNASYSPDPHPYLLCSLPKQASLHSSQSRKMRRLIVAERRRLGVVYWAVGYGWRLRKDYRERLEAEAEAIKKVEAKNADM